MKIIDKAISKQDEIVYLIQMNDKTYWKYHKDCDKSLIIEYERDVDLNKIYEIIDDSMIGEPPMMTSKKSNYIEVIVKLT